MAGGLTLAVAAGLMLLPGQLLGPERPVHLAVPVPQAAVSVEAVPPLPIRHRPVVRTVKPALRAGAETAISTPLAQARAVVPVSKARLMLKSHRVAVVSQLAPRAPLVPGRQIAAVPATAPAAVASASQKQRTIAALAAILRKK